MAKTRIPRAPAVVPEQKTAKRIGQEVSASLKFTSSMNETDKEKLVLTKIAEIVQKVIQDEKGPINSVRRRQPIQWITDSIQKLLKDSGLDKTSDILEDLQKQIKEIDSNGSDVSQKLKDIQKRIESTQKEQSVGEIKNSLKKFLEGNEQVGKELANIQSIAKATGLKTANIEKITGYVNRVSRQINIAQLDLQKQSQRGFLKTVTSFKMLGEQIQDKFIAFSDTIVGKITLGLGNWFLLKPLKWIGKTLSTIGKNLLTSIGETIKQTFSDVSRGFWGLLFKAIQTPPGMFAMGLITSFLWHKFLKPAIEWVAEHWKALALGALGVLLGYKGAKFMLKKALGKILGTDEKTPKGEKSGKEKSGKGADGEKVESPKERELKEKLNEKQSKLEELEKRQKAVTAERDELKAQGDKLKAEQRKLRTEVREHAAKIDKLNQDIGKARLSENTKLAEELSKSRVVATDALNALKNEVKELENARKAIGTQIQGLNEELKGLGEAVKNTNAAIAKTAGELDKAVKGAEQIGKLAETAKSAEKAAAAMTKATEAATKASKASMDAVKATKTVVAGTETIAKPTSVGGTALGGIFAALGFYEVATGIYDVSKNGLTVENWTKIGMGSANAVLGGLEVGQGLGLITALSSAMNCLWFATIVVQIGIAYLQSQIQQNELLNAARAKFQPKLNQVGNAMTQYAKTYPTPASRLVFASRNLDQILRIVRDFKESYLDTIEKMRKELSEEYKKNNAKTYLTKGGGYPPNFSTLNQYYCFEVGLLTEYAKKMMLFLAQVACGLIAEEEFYLPQLAAGAQGLEYDTMFVQGDFQGPARYLNGLNWEGQVRQASSNGGYVIENGTYAEFKEKHSDIPLLPTSEADVIHPERFLGTKYAIIRRRMPLQKEAFSAFDNPVVEALWNSDWNRLTQGWREVGGNSIPEVSDNGSNLLYNRLYQLRDKLQKNSLTPAEKIELDKLRNRALEEENQSDTPQENHKGTIDAIKSAADLSTEGKIGIAHINQGNLILATLDRIESKLTGNVSVLEDTVPA